MKLFALAAKMDFVAILNKFSQVLVLILNGVHMP